MINCLTAYAHCDTVCHALNKGRGMKKVTPNLMVKNVTNSVEFYRDTLGFQLVMGVPEAGPFDWALMKNGTAEIMLQSRDSLAKEIASFRDAHGCSCALYFDVDDVQALYERIRTRAFIVRDMHTTFYGTGEFALSDPDGHILVFAQDLN